MDKGAGIMARVKQWQYKVRNFLGRIIWRLSWRNRNRIEKFMKWLRDKGHIVFDGITPCLVRSRHEWREIDDDRYYDMIDMGVVNLLTREKYTITEYE